ncbi:MAG: tungsten ABC transporter substrate-binding protein [Chloroflexi bacterium RBG_16_68_14]|nr:MAG: tungsten ABC transporter substrate-binding protein [Chloroflexi bacterium RBG_16_68_14]
MTAPASRAARAFSLMAVLLLFLGAACRSEGNLILATTTSTYDSGLLDVLVPAFEDATGYQVKVIAVGTGQALEMGRRGDADVLLVHAPDAEEEFVAQGYGINRQLVMHNDFVIVGPADDPAGVEDAPDALAALAAIAGAGAGFVSRGDGSGTHQLELSLWEELGLDPTDASWYQEAGQGMGATLQIANQRDAYTITDRATYLALREHLDLEVLSEGDPRLLNIYHVMQVNPERFGGVNAAGAQAFVAFLLSDAAQELIRDFGIDEYGQPLFVPDAGKTADELSTP